MTRDRTPIRGITVMVAIVVVSLAVVASAGSAATAAQQAPATAFITINPEAGFPLDPFIVSLQAGGPVDASTVAKGCKGFLTKNPALSVDYKGKAEILKIFFYSDGDPVLLIQTPDGKFVCNDNTNAALLDPTVTLTKPAQGRYNIWLGSALARDLIPGFLVFTGQGRRERRRLGAAKARQAAGPARGAAFEQSADGGRRPRGRGGGGGQVGGEAGAGRRAAHRAGDGHRRSARARSGNGRRLCGGLITVAPSYAFEWSGQAKALGVMFEGDGDATVIVRTPEGKFVCADDAAGSANLNPLVIVKVPRRGVTWCGSAGSIRRSR